MDQHKLKTLNNNRFTVSLSADKNKQAANLETNNPKVG